MNKNHLLLVGLALALSLIAVLFVGGDVDTGELELDAAVDYSAEVDEGQLAPAPRLEEPAGVVEAAAGVALEGREEVAVELAEEADAATHTVRVQVVDGAGHPVLDVPVDMYERFSRGFRWETALTTAPDGIAVIKWTVEPLESAEKGSTWSVSVRALTSERISELIDIESLPDEPIVLRISEMGSVEVSVVDEAWGAFGGAGSVELFLVPPGERREQSPFASRERPSAESDLIGGRAKFDLVQLGMDLEAVVTREHAVVHSRVFGEGPRVPGETVELEVRLGADHPVVRSRAVRGGGGPIVDSRLEIDLALGDLYTSNTQKLNVSTDATGFFLVDVERWTKGSRYTMTVRHAPEGGSEVVGSVDLTRELENGLNELGDVLLGAPPIFVGGWVRTESGKPLANAKLALRTRTSRGGGWRDDRTFEHTAREDGSFEVTRVVPGEKFQLAATVEGHACRWYTFDPGEKGLVISLSAGSGIAGRLLLDDQVPAERIQIRIGSRQSDDENLSWSDRSKQPGEDGSFLFDRLLPGKRDVTIQFERQRLPLLEVEDVEVLAGEVTRDPRLQSIDLRGKFWVHDLELAGGDKGEQIRGAVHFGPAGEEFDDHYWIDKNELQLISRSEHVDLRVMATGYRAEERRGVGRKSEITLRKGLVVGLVLTGEAQLPDPPIYVKANLVPTDGSPESPDWGGDAFDEKREIKVRVPSSGKLRVEWLVERRSTASSVATSMNLEREQIIEVLDIGEGQRFEVSLTQEEMDEIVARLD